MSKMKTLQQYASEMYKIPVSLYKNNRLRLIERLEKATTVPDNSFVLLQGGCDENDYCSDNERLFRQESYFKWTFGVREPEFFGAIDLKQKKSILFAPRLPADYAIWMGKIQPLSHFKDVYGVDEIYYTDELKKVFREKNASLLYLLYGQNSDSKSFSKPAHFEGIEEFKVEKETLHKEITECRVFKSPEEIEIYRYTNKISAEAHKECMKACKPGMYEFQLESVFRHTCFVKGGLRLLSFTPIVGSGYNSATLHYGHAGAPNDKMIEDGDMMLLDMGGEYECYTSDQTISFPANGKFTEAQREVHGTVLAMRNAVEAAMKPGVTWFEMADLAYRVMCEHLLKFDFCRNGTVDDLMKVGMGKVFQPHGLGHLMGMNTHDVGGFNDGSKRSELYPALRSTRELKPGMIFTCEPGMYFIDHLLDAALANPEQAKYLNAEKVNRFRGFGGCRMEDDLVITETGAENLTHLPRTQEEIEEFMKH
eukprot:GCRY01000393.1.p2 GENE.GCRY01000393.1~~GCRY01000393.1.p2  ORF type:complete len:480 (+),score=116.01 GCRY01000393.1:128-1567(+)